MALPIAIRAKQSLKLVSYATNYREIKHFSFQRKTFFNCATGSSYQPEAFRYRHKKRMKKAWFPAQIISPELF